MAHPDDVVTSVFARVVPARAAPAYEAWLERIAEDAGRANGSLGTTILRPEGSGGRYIAMTTFASTAHLQRWLDSPQRAERLRELASMPITVERTEHRAGVARWFADPRASAPPANAKIATLLVLGLFPIVLALQPVSNLFADVVPAPLRTLISLAISVSLMVWVVMPILTRATKRWLHPPHPTRVTLAGDATDATDADDAAHGRDGADSPDALDARKGSERAGAVTPDRT